MDSSRADAILARLWNRTTVEQLSDLVATPCWAWQGSRVRGYGRMWLEGRIQLVHRIAYQLLVGDIPDGLETDHLCRVRACWNISHLEMVPRRINVLRGVSPQAQLAARTYCKRGHLLVPHPNPNKSRLCQQCVRLMKRGAYLRRYPDSHRKDGPRRTHCRRGHEFTPENSRIRKDGIRECIACKRASDRNNYHQRQANRRALAGG